MPIVVTNSGKKYNFTDEQIQGAIQSGQWWDLGEPAYLKTKDKEGNVFEVQFTPSSLQNMHTQGFVPYTDIDLQEEAVKGRHTGAGAMLRTAALSALSGATFGLSDAIAKDFIDARKIALDRKYNPGVDVTANIAGAIAPVLLTGGSGSLAKVAGITPVGKLAKTASDVEKVIATSMQTAGKGQLATTLAKSVPYAVEGSIYGLGQEISDMVVNNKPLAIEHLMTNMGLGAALGFGTSVGMNLMSRNAKKAKDAIRSEQIGAVKPDTAAEAIYKQHILKEGEFPALSQPGIREKGLGIISETPAEKIANVTKSPEMRSYIGKETENINQISRDLAKDVDELSSVNDLVIDTWGKHKFENVEKYIDKTIPYSVEARDAGLQTLQLLDSLSKSKEYGTAVKSASDKAIKEINARLGIKPGATMDEILSKIDSNENLFLFLDQTKKALGKATDKISRRASPTELAALDELEPQFFKLREVLEDNKLWGKLADDQRLINEPMSAYISSKKSNIRTKVSKKEFIDVYEGDPGKIKRVLSKLGDPESDIQMRLLNRENENFLRMIQVMDTRIGLPRGTLKKVEDNITRRKDLLVKAAKVREANAVYKSLQSPGTAQVTMPLLGGFAGGGLGAFGGSVLANISSPTSYIRYLRVMDRFRAFSKNIQNTKSAINKSVDNYITKEPTGKWLPSAISKTGTSLADTYTNTVESLRMLSDPSVLYDSIIEATPGLQQDDPEMGLHLFLQAMEQIGYLNTLIPQELSFDLVDLAQGKPPQVSKKKMRDFLDKVAVLDNPMEAIKNLENLSDAQLEALKNISPNIFEELKATIIKKLSEGKPIPYKKKINLSKILGIPVTSSMNPQFIQSLQSRRDNYRAQEQQRQSGNANNMRLDRIGQMYSSQSSRLANKI